MSNRAAAPFMRLNAKSLFAKEMPGCSVECLWSDAALGETEMRRQSVILLGVLVLVAGGTITVIWTQIVPKYRAKAEVRVRPIIPYLVFRTEDSGMIPLYQSFLNTQVSIMRSLPVLQRVLDQQEIQETQWYKKPPEPLVQRLRGGQAIPPMERLRDDLFVRPRRGTEIIDVAFITSSADEAKLIVNAVLEQYKKYVGETSDATKDKLYNQLAEQYKSLETEILGRENITAELRKTLGTGTPQELISAKRVRLDDTQARLRELQQSIAVLEWERKDLEDLMKRDVAEDSEGAAAGRAGIMEREPKYYRDAEWRKLDVEIRTIRHNIAASEVDPNAPDMVRAQKDLEFAEELLRLRETQLDKERRDQLINANAMQIATAVADGLSGEEALMLLEHQVTRAKHEEQLLLAEYISQQTEFGELFKSAQLLEKENNTLLHKKGLFAAVQQRLDQRNMERNVPGPIEILTWALAPSEPHKDRRVVFTAMTLVLSLGMSGGFALLRRRRTT